MLAAAILCLTLVACGEKGTKYTFKEIKDEGDLPGAPVDTLSKLYQDSYIIVGNGKIEWWMKDTAQTMTYTMDGDKYIIGGEFAGTLEQEISGGVAGTMYGQKTEEGFEIITETIIAAGTMRVVYCFTAA